jgi:hypothetical protein
MSTQYFLFEMVLNLITYFAFFFIITLVIARCSKFIVPEKLARFFWVTFGMVIVGFGYLSIQMDDRYLIKRDFELKIFDSGFAFLEMHSTGREKYSQEPND